MKQFAAILLLGFASWTNAGQYDAPNTLHGRTLMVQLFSWKWTDIKNECPWLAAHGYGAVQVSPPQEHVIITNPNRPWWEGYQPVSYQLYSRSGDYGEFVSMVAACNNCGVRIIVDAVINHMVGSGQDGTGNNGCPFHGHGGSEKFLCVPYDSRHFNDPKCHTSSGGIENWNNATEIRVCRLLGLLDLDQSQEHVREEIAEYLNDLIDVGVAGIRIDAGKHMYPGDIYAILDKTKDLDTRWFPANTRLFVVQEIIDYGSGVIHDHEYIGNGRVTNFRYGRYVSDAVRKSGQNFMYFGNFGTDWAMLDGIEVVNFIDNHDTQREDHPPLTYKDGGSYVMAVSYMLAWPYGYQRVMSSYDFQNRDQGPPSNGADITSPIFKPDETCDQSSGWICEHRWPVIRRMAKFRAVCEGKPAEYIVDTYNHRIAFSRTDTGFFAINNDNSEWSHTFTTSLPAGQYCDVVSGEPVSGGCTGLRVTITTDHKLVVTIPTPTPFAIHVGAEVPPPPGMQRTVIFLRKVTTDGEDVFVRGGIDHSRMTGCTGPLESNNCAIPIFHETKVSSTYISYVDWRQGDNFLDWHGAEDGQGEFNGNAAQGTPLVWSTNATGDGHQDLNNYGAHYWMVEFLMDCSKAYNGKYFEFKGMMNDGTWESGINQVVNCAGSAGLTRPFTSQNHIGECGKINVFKWNDNGCTVNNFT